MALANVHFVDNDTMAPNRRRPHKKSRNGCLTCKQRRVKCDECHPVCQNCSKKGITCTYKQIPFEKKKVSKQFKFKDMSQSFHTEEQPNHESNLIPIKSTKPNEEKQKINDLLMDYSLMTDIVLDLTAYFDSTFVVSTFPEPNTGAYVSRLFHEVSKKYKFLKHIFLAIASLEIYYTSDYSDPVNTDEMKKTLHIYLGGFIKNYPKIDKSFMLRIAHLHKKKCVDLFQPMQNDDAESLLDKEVSEVMVMTAALICFYLICSTNYRFCDTKLYKSYKSFISFRRIGHNYGLDNTPKNLVDLYRNRPSEQELEQASPFPRRLYNLLNIQKFEYENGKVVVETEPMEKGQMKAKVERKHLKRSKMSLVKKHSKLAIQSILNANSDESASDEDTGNSIESFYYDGEVKKKASFELNVEIESDDETYINSNDNHENKQTRSDVEKCRSFPTYVVRTTDESGNPKDILKNESTYVELLEIIKNIALTGESKHARDPQAPIVKFALFVSRSESILQSMDNKDPRVMIIIAYLIAYISTFQCVWWYECLTNEMDYLKKIIGPEWIHWIDEAVEIVNKNDWRKKVVKKQPSPSPQKTEDANQLPGSVNQALSQTSSPEEITASVAMQTLMNNDGSISRR